MNFFPDSESHLLEELRRIELLVHAHIRRAPKAAGDAQFQGLCISDAEIDRLCGNSTGMPEWAVAPLPDEVNEQLASVRECNLRLAERAVEHGVELRLARLIDAFELTRLDLDILLIALAPEFDLRFEKFYAYLQDDVTRKFPTVDLALNLTCASMREKLAARTRFEPSSPLLRHGLVELCDETGSTRAPLPAKVLKADPGIAGYLAGGSVPDPRLGAMLRLVEPARGFSDLILPPEFIEGLKSFGSDGALLYFKGPKGAGKKSAAEAMCCESGRRVAIVSAAQLTGGGDFEANLRLIVRECRLHRAVLYVDEFDALLDDTKRAQCESLLRAISSGVDFAMLAGEQAWEPPAHLLDRRYARVDFDVPPFQTRLDLWSRLGAFPGIDPEALANQFHFTAGQILEAMAVAGNLARWRGAREVTMEDLLTACRSRSNTRLALLATHITPRCTWSDLVLSEERLRQLREICDSVRHRGHVYDSWGFGRKLRGKGINILFAGSSGTGKTMAAEAIAHELGLDLYKIDLSTVVSKYIGETEKNLSRIFAEARSSNAILFFDEADALFGKRTAVQDAHDRYANIETNYLLQKMEEHEGLAILATNLGKNMDEAFTRRLYATIEFTMPSAEERLRIWKNIWPADAPLHAGLDFDFMARRFEIPGGNIRNIALLAAFLASADSGSPIDMSHLMRATRLEYQKMRSVITGVDFGEYMNLSREHLSKV